MATLEEIKELLRGETGPINSKLDNLSANFEELKRTVQFLSAKYDQLLPQVKQTNEKLHKHTLRINATKEELGKVKKCAADAMFFATTSGPYTESALSLPFLNLLDVLTVNNVYRLHALKFTHLWHKGLLPSLFDNLFQYVSYRHTHNTRYASKQNFCKPRPRPNTGKQMFSYQAIDLWRDIPYSLKEISTFAKEIKHYLLSEQYSKKFV